MRSAPHGVDDSGEGGDAAATTTTPGALEPQGGFESPSSQLLGSPPPRLSGDVDLSRYTEAEPPGGRVGEIGFVCVCVCVCKCVPV